MEEQVELKRVYGDVYFRARRDQANSIVYAHWYGVQAVETVQEGGYRFLEMIRAKPYRKLLNSNEHVIGAWDLALDWAEREWAPQMRKGGLRYLAYVVPTTIYATMTMEMLIQRIDDAFEIRTFDREADAEAWLLSVD